MTNYQKIRSTTMRQKSVGTNYCRGRVTWATRVAPNLRQRTLRGG